MAFSDQLHQASGQQNNRAPRNKNYDPQPHGEKRCYICKVVKDYSHFYKTASSKDGYAFDCKECNKQRKKTYSAKAYSPQPHGEKKCRVCQTIKDYTCFWKDKSSRDGYRHECNDCRKQKSRSLKPPRKLGIAALRANEYVALYNKQGGRCAICGMPEIIKGGISLAIDHDHISGATRGLLCFNCNTGLGRFKDDPDLLRAAITYLETSLTLNNDIRTCSA